MAAPWLWIRSSTPADFDSSDVVGRDQRFVEELGEGPGLVVQVSHVFLARDEARQGCADERGILGLPRSCSPVRLPMISSQWSTPPLGGRSQDGCGCHRAGLDRASLSCWPVQASMSHPSAIDRRLHPIEQRNKVAGVDDF